MLEGLSAILDRRSVRGHSQRTSEARVGGGFRNPDKLGHREGGILFNNPDVRV